MTRLPLLQRQSHLPFRVTTPSLVKFAPTLAFIATTSHVRPGSPFPMTTK